MGSQFYDNEDGLEPEWTYFEDFILPLGFEISWRLFDTLVPGWFSSGIFISLLDMGKIMDYSADEFSSVTFNTILAPGIGFILGISPLPFTLGVMYQHMIEADGWRLSFFCAVDIMLLRL
jgi:hypothetical protein